MLVQDDYIANHDDDVQDDGRPPNQDNTSAVGLLVPDQASQQRFQDYGPRLTDMDIEWALSMLLCCCHNARYGDSRLVDGMNKVRRYAYPSLWASSLQAACSNGHFHFALPIHITDHWFAVLADVVQNRHGEANGQDILSEGNIAPTMSITSINVFNSVASTTPDDDFLLRKSKNILEAFVTGPITCCQTSTDDDGNHTVIDRIVCAQQESGSLGCGIFTIIHAWRFLMSRDPLQPTADPLYVNKVL